MACHAKAARLWIFHESSHLIVSDLFIFSIQCFSAHSISLCVDTPCTNPTHAPPSPLPPPPAHATLSSPSPTLSQVVLRCPSNTAMKDHYKLSEPVNKSTLPLCPPPPCTPTHTRSPLLSPLMWRSRWISKQTFSGPPSRARYLLPMQMDSETCKDPKGSALFHRPSWARVRLHVVCLSEWTTRYFGRIENKARTWPQRCSRAHGGSKRPPCPSFQRRRKKWREPG